MQNGCNWPSSVPCSGGDPIPGTVFSVTGAYPITSTGGSAPLIGLLTVPIGFGGTGATTVPGAQAALGIGSLGLQDSSSVSITGGTISGVNITGGTITNQANPLNPQDVATKAYVDAFAAGLNPRSSVQLASTGNLTLSGEQIVDGVLTSASRALVKDNVTTSQNGIYVTAAGAWTRATDSDTALELAKGFYYFVQQGTTNASSGWVIQTAPTIINVSPVLFTQFSSPGAYSAGAGLTLLGLQFSVSTSGITTNAVTASAGTLTLSPVSGSNLVLGTSGGGIVSTTSAIQAPSLTSAGSLSLSAASGQNLNLSSGNSAGAVNITSGAANDIFLNSPVVVVQSANPQLALNSTTGPSNYSWSTYFNGANGIFNLSNTSTGFLDVLRFGLTGLLSLPQYTSNGFLKTSGGTGSVVVDTSTYLTSAITNLLGTANEIAVSAPVGTSAISLPSALTFTGKTVTRGTFLSGAFNGVLGSAVDPAFGFIGSTAGIYSSGASELNLVAGGVNRVQIRASDGRLSGQDIWGVTFGSFSLAGIRASKTNFNIIINVKDYGALGNGLTDDTSAINLAIAAMTNNSALYFPPGQYNNTGLSNITGLTNIMVFGQGATLFQLTQANTMLLVDRTSSRVTIKDIRFGGSASTRLNGIHLRFDASDSTIDSCEFYGASDFGMFVGQHNNATQTSAVTVINCYSHDNKGDSFHADNVDGVYFIGCQAVNSGDDSFGFVGYEASADVARNIFVYDCSVKNSAFRGIAAIYVDGLTVNNFKVNGSVGAGIEISADNNHTSVFNDHIVLRNCDMANCVSSSGPFGAFNIYFTNNVQLQNCTVINPINAQCIAIFDWLNIQMSNVSVVAGRTGFCRGLFCVDVAQVRFRSGRAHWGILSLSNFLFDMADATNANAVWLKPDASYDFGPLVITGASGRQIPVGDYISYDRIAVGGKVGNNTCTPNQTVSFGGTGVAPTTFNNN